MSNLRKRPASPASRMGIRVPSPLSSGEKVAARPDEGFCPRKNGNSHSLCFFFEYSVEHIAILGFVGCAV